MFLTWHSSSLSDIASPARTDANKNETSKCSHHTAEGMASQQGLKKKKKDKKKKKEKKKTTTKEEPHAEVDAFYLPDEHINNRF